jgi:hypothetical protein
MAPTLLPSLPPVVHEEDHFVALGALAADRRSRIHARPSVGLPFHADMFALRRSGELT